MQIICVKGCLRTIGYAPNDVLSRHGTDVWGDRDGREWIICPGCGKDIVLRAW